MNVLVCLKWVDLRPEIDPLSGSVTTDPRFGGASAADLAALEWGLRLAASTGGELTVASVGPADAEPMLREAIAVGANRALLIPSPSAAAPHRLSLPSERVAELLASVGADADVICCGLHSADRGSGSVPAFLANALRRPQALGLVSASVAPNGQIIAERRLDHGRRERLGVTGRCVLSFEGGIEARRASLTAALAAMSAVVEVVDPGELTSEASTYGSAIAGPEVVSTGPYRPRAKVKAPPAGTTHERISSLLAAEGGEAVSATVHELPPAEAAQLVIKRLVDWGYLEPSTKPVT